MSGNVAQWRNKEGKTCSVLSNLKVGDKLHIIAEADVGQ
jgi:hypothetical protein